MSETVFSPNEGPRPTLPAPQVVSTIQPRWMRIIDATRYSGLSRSGIYEQIAAGGIKSVCLRRRGALRGIRLVDRESIDLFMESQLAEQEQEIATEEE